MIRLTSMAIAMLIGVAPIAQAVTCSERIADLSKKMEAVTDATKKTSKEEAAKHLAMAKEAMAKNDENGCMTHTDAGLNMLHGD
jgi:hypothetical protein